MCPSNRSLECCPHKQGHRDHFFQREISRLVRGNRASPCNSLGSAPCPYLLSSRPQYLPGSQHHARTHLQLFFHGSYHWTVHAIREPDPLRLLTPRQISALWNWGFDMVYHGDHPVPCEDYHEFEVLLLYHERRKFDKGFAALRKASLSLMYSLVQGRSNQLTKSDTADVTERYHTSTLVGARFNARCSGLEC